MTFSVGYPVKCNHALEAEKVRTIAINTLGAEHVHSDIPPSMAQRPPVPCTTPATILTMRLSAQVSRYGTPLSKHFCPSRYKPKFSTFFRHGL